MENQVPDWVKDAIFYEIFPERFANGDPTNDPPGVDPWGSPPTRTNFNGGDLRGLIDKLDYLETLGITALYLTPIFAADTNHKYDTVDYCRIDPHFGDLATFRQLIREAHQRGIRVILDAVFNHVGEGFWAFRDVLKQGEASPYVNWFYIEDLPVTKHPNPNYETYENADYLVKLNIHNPEVRRHLYEVARLWTREGIDGWRLDVPFLMNHHFWKRFRREVKEISPEVYIVAEVWREATDWLQGDECDGAMNYRLRDLLLQFFIQETLDGQGFDRALTALRAEHPGQSSYTMLNLIGSHDTARFLTLCRGDKKRFQMSVAFLFAYLGVPMIYYGDEIGMTGNDDPECRRPMVWDPSGQDQEMLEWHRQLIVLRKTHAALRRGTLQSVYTAEDVYAFERKAGPDYALVVVNRGAEVETITLPVDSVELPAEVQDAFSGRIYRRQDTIRVDGLSTLILTGMAS